MLGLEDSTRHIAIKLYEKVHALVLFVEVRVLDRQPSGSHDIEMSTVMSSTQLCQ